VEIEAKVVLATRCDLGEGLHWDSQRKLLWFVDIHGPTLHWFDPATRAAGSRSLPEPIGWVLSVRNSERLLVGLKSGTALLDAFNESAQPEWVDRSFPGQADQRLNDAKADKLGRLWYGSMSATDESQPVGRFARCEIGRRSPVIVDAGYTVTNGPAFDADCTTLLHSDSGRGIVYRYSLDVHTGVASPRAIWKKFAAGDGYPDGMCFDAEGCVWIAHWGAAKLCRYDSEGTRLLTVDLPAAQVTNVCFGGEHMDRIFVTTASRGLSGEQKRHNRPPERCSKSRVSTRAACPRGRSRLRTERVSLNIQREPGIVTR
jgi:D-xylonolactonase